MFVRRLLLAITMTLMLITTCSCGVVGPVGGAIVGIVGLQKIFEKKHRKKPVPPPPLLEVARGPATPAGRTAQYDETDITAAQLKLTVNHEEDVDVSSITLAIDGTVNGTSDVSAVKLYFDDNQNGQINAPEDMQLGGDQTFSGGKATFNFASRTIQSQDSECYIAVVDLAGTADDAEYFRIGVADNADIIATETVGSTPVDAGGAPVYGDQFNIQGVGQIEVALGDNCPSDGGVPEGASNVVVMQLKVSAGNAEPIALSSLTLTASGTLNDSSSVITAVKLYRDQNNNGVFDEGAGAQIDTTKTFSGDNGTVDFDLSTITLSAGQRQNWLVIYDLANGLTPNETFQVRLVQSSHISGTGTITSDPAMVVGAPVNGPTMYVQGVGTVNVTSVSGSPPDYSDVPFVGEWPILHLAFTTGPNEPVEIINIIVSHSVAATANVATDVSEVRLYHDANGNGRYDSYADGLPLTTGTYSGNSATLSSFTLRCTANDTTYALVQYVMAGEETATSGRTHQVTLDTTTDIQAQGYDTGQPITPGSTIITGPTMVVRRNYWVSVAASPLEARYQHAAVSTGTDLIVWGGRGTGSTYYKNGAVYHPLEDTWDTTTTSGAPSERYRHCAVWTGTKLFIWGGYNPTDAYLGNGAMYDPAADSWSTITSTNAPTSRMDAMAIWTGSKVVVWGGYSGTYDATGGIYDPATDEWTETDYLGPYAPLGRRYTAADWNGSGMIVWGGFRASYLNDGAVYNTLTNSWSEITTAGAPAGRREHTGLWCSDRFVVWGGYNGTQHIATGSYYRSGSWQDLNLVAGPTGRSQHTAVWDGKYVTVWGGRDSSAVLQTGSRYETADDNWYTTTTTNAPSARRQHGAAWAGAGMVIWGGNISAIGYSPNDTGGRYLP